ncbi:50S ribosomal protein L21e [Candidatus Woesearchaeota archaeon]|nr:50S ribosomal protein L21e [Candidatus Woesearchaeota archaeon]MBI2661618.1 50S ribosomal protein L21e [Candidatus Woesearchaeota archaeon]
MVTRIGGMRRKTRYKFRKEQRAKGKISMSRYFQKFSVGDKVALGVEPAVHKGMYHPNYIGKIGTVTAKRGSCYMVSVMDANKQKTLIAHPVHLKRA